jgi:hypothetical protein
MKMSKLQTLAIATLCLTIVAQVKAQDRTMLEKTKEMVVKKHVNNNEVFGAPMGRSAHQILCDMGCEDTIALCALDERHFTCHPKFKKMYISPDRKIHDYNSLDSFVFYSETHVSKGYIQLIIRISDTEILLDRISDWDKHIHSAFSSDGKYLIVDKFDPFYAGAYVPKEDNRFTVYYVDSLRKSTKSSFDIPCFHCANAQLVNNKFFFTVSLELVEEGEGFWNDFLYVAPWERLQDSVRIAVRTDIKAISSDGKYILAERLDMSNGVCVIIDVETKKYQILLGRDYNKHPAFYSYEKEKFAFDFGDYIVYVDFPTEYPFDALEQNLQFWSDGFAIKEEFQHKSLEFVYKIQSRSKK